MHMNTGLLDIRQDYIFKLVFADERNKDILIAFLNAILKGEPHIYDLTIQNPEMPKISKNNRWMYLDIKAKIDDNQYVNIEMQARNTVDLIDRGIQYLGRMLVAHSNRLQPDEQPEQSKWDYAYPKVIGIWVLGERLSKDYGTPVNEALMTFKPNELRSFQIISDKVRLFTIELPKFNPKKPRHKDMLANWMAFFNNPMDEEALKNYEIHKALEALQYLSADKKIRAAYEARNDAILNEVSPANSSWRAGEKVGIEKGEKIGIEKGEKIGIEKGKAEEREKAHQEKIERAKKMLADSLPIDLVAKYSGLSLEELQNLV